jgi:hypothetical protein
MEQPTHPALGQLSLLGSGSHIAAPRVETPRKQRNDRRPIDFKSPDLIFSRKIVCGSTAPSLVEYFFRKYFFAKSDFLFTRAD